MKRLINECSTARKMACAWIVLALILCQPSFERHGVAQSSERPGVALSSNIPAPVAIDAIVGTGLLVLDSEGSVYEYKQLGKTKESVHAPLFHFRINDGDLAQDMTIAVRHGQTYIFILARAKYGISRGTIYEYSYENGKGPMRAWSLDEIATGIDYDEVSGALYFVIGANARLFRIRLDDPKIELVGTLLHVGRAGPLAVLPGKSLDGKGTKLYVGDVKEGGIYEYQVGTGFQAQVSKYIGVVSAELTYHRKNQKFASLYAADSTRRLIVPFDIQTNGSLVAKTWVAEKYLRYPASLAIITGFNVVADGGRNALIVYDENWNHLYDLPLSKQNVAN